MGFKNFGDTAQKRARLKRAHVGTTGAQHHRRSEASGTSCHHSLIIAHGPIMVVSLGPKVRKYAQEGLGCVLLLFSLYCFLSVVLSIVLYCFLSVVFSLLFSLYCFLSIVV